MTPITSERAEQLRCFCGMLQEAQTEGLRREGLDPSAHDHHITLRIGQLYARVDVGSSDRYMVELSTGEIFGIRSDCAPNRRRTYGTLDTLHEWDWSGYRAVRRVPVVLQPAIDRHFEKIDVPQEAGPPDDLPPCTGKAPFQDHNWENVGGQEQEGDTITKRVRCSECGVRAEEVYKLDARRPERGASIGRPPRV